MSFVSAAPIALLAAVAAPLVAVFGPTNYTYDSTVRGSNFSTREWVIWTSGLMRKPSDVAQKTPEWMVDHFEEQRTRSDWLAWRDSLPTRATWPAMARKMAWQGSPVAEGRAQHIDNTSTARIEATTLRMHIVQPSLGPILVASTF